MVGRALVIIVPSIADSIPVRDRATMIAQNRDECLGFGEAVSMARGDNTSSWENVDSSGEAILAADWFLNVIRSK
jgi:hypothetical protein